MNKKAIIKVGSVLFILLLFSVCIFLISVSRASNEKSNVYYLGEKVRLNFEDLTSTDTFKVKIQTPSSEYVARLDSKTFLFNPTELGSYSIYLYDSGEMVISFEVKDESERPSEIVPDNQVNLSLNYSTVNLSENVTGNLSLNETTVENYTSNETVKVIDLDVKNQVNYSDDLIVANREVVWKEQVNSDESSVEYRLPLFADNISVYEINDENRSLVNFTVEEQTGIMHALETFISGDESKIINFEKTSEQMEVTYTTPAPVLTEGNVSEDVKAVAVEAAEELGYVNVVAYSEIPEKLKLSQKENIIVYWDQQNTKMDFEVYDLDNDGFIDYIDWMVPHLSRQTFQIILITKAEHLDSNKFFLEDIYELVKNKDDVLSPIINDGEFVRVTFEVNLTNESDITLFPKIVSGTPRIEVYELANNLRIAEFSQLNDLEYNQVLLTNFTGSQDTFDLRIVGGSLQFDHIIDPQMFYENWEANNTVNWNDIGWTTATDQAVNTFSIKCLPGANCDMNTSVLINATNAVSINVTFQYRDDDNDAADVIWYWRDNTGNWDNMGDIDAGTLGTPDDTWNTLSLTSASAQYAHSDFAIRFFADPEAGGGGTAENYWIDNINVSLIRESVQPAVTIVSPLNITYNTNVISFNVTLNENGGWCGYSLNGNANVTMTQLNATSYGLVNSTMTQGGHSVRFYCNDTSGNMNNSVTLRYFGVDFSPPSISILSPLNNTIVKDVTPLLNVTVSKNSSTLWYTLNNGVNNYTLCNDCTGVQSRYLHLAEGNYNFRVYANDSANNIGVNSTNFTINMNFSEFDTYLDNSSIDSYSGTVFGVGNITSTLGTVLSVQNTGIALASGTSQSNSLMTKSQNSSNVVPFVTYSHSSAGASEDWQHHLTNVYINTTRVFVNRSSTTATLDFNISLVEFNPSKVRVQSGVVCSATVAGCNVTLSSSINTSRSFLLFYPQITGTIDDDANMASVLGNITSTNQVRFQRTGLTGVIGGTWYVVESLDDSFTVQNRHISMATVASANSSIASVQMNRTFLIASLQATTATDDSADYSPRLYLVNTTLISANKGTAADNVQMNVYIITFSRDLNVQRGTLTYATGAATSTNTSLRSVNLNMSMAWSPTVMGKMQSDSVAADNLQSSFNRMYLDDQTTIIGVRGLTVGNTLASFEVLDFSPASRYFISKSINTTYNITQITNISWSVNNNNTHNNISVEVSFDNGQTYYNVERNKALNQIVPGRAMLYRALFNTDGSRAFSLLDITINWSNSSVPVPSLSILSPLNNTVVKDVTPLLNVSVSDSVEKIWYTLNNGATNFTLCDDCTGVQSRYLHLAEGNYMMKVYLNDSINRINSNSTNFTINMNFSEFDTYLDNSSIDSYSGTVFGVGNITSTLGTVLSVQNTGIALASGTSQSNSLMTKSQNSSNVVPFVTYSHSSAGASEDWENHLTNVYLNTTRVFVNRSSTTADLAFNISLVEFNPGKVKVQSGSVCNAAVAGCTVAIPDSVNRSRSFLLFYPQITGTIDDDAESAAVYGNISSDNVLTFIRTDVTGTIGGTWYVVESLDDSFTVQSRPISLNAASSASASISSINTSKTFLITSYSTDIATDDAASYSPRVFISNSTSINAVKGDATGNTQLNVYVITFTRDLMVQRGNLTYAAGTATVTNTNLSSVNLAMSMAWNPTVMGKMQTDSNAVDALQSAFNRIYLSNQTTIIGARGLTVGNSIASYEVLDFSPTAQSFTAKSINTTVVIRQITNVTWSEHNTDTNNNITFEISANNGSNWTQVNRGGGVQQMAEGNNLIYRVLFNTNNTRIISLLDLTINWSSFQLPNINVVYPTNINYSTNVTALNYTISGTGLNSCWYSLNNGVTNTTVTCGNNLTGLTSNEGYNNWTVYADNTNGDVGSSTVTFFKDTLLPNVTLISPANVTTFTTDSATFSWNVTDNLDDQLICNLTIAGSVIGHNLVSVNGNITSYLATGLAEGTHLWNVTCVDNLGNRNYSETRTVVIDIQTSLYRITKGNGTTSGDTTDIVISPALNNMSKALHFVSYRHLTENDHSNTFRSSEIVNNTLLRLYGDSSGGSIAISYEYMIIEFTSDSPLFVQRDTLTVPNGGPASINSSFTVAVNLTEAFIVYQGHNHNQAETTIGNEELDRIVLVNETTWEYTTGSAINSGPQENRVEIVDWNDKDFVKRVQRNITSLGAAATSVTVTPPIAVNPNKTLLFVSFYESAGSATSEPPSEIGVMATLGQNGNIVIQREAAGPTLSIAWQLVEFQTSAVNVYHIQANLTTGQLTNNFTISQPVSVNRTVVLGTAESPFGHSGARASSTTVGAIDRSMFTMELLNSTSVRAIRGDSTGSANLGIQVWEFTGIPQISNINATNIASTSTTITWDTDVIANSSVRYGINMSNLNLSNSSNSFVTAQSLSLSNLIANTTYFYNVTSCNSNGCTSAGIYNFTTTSVPASAPVVILTSPTSGNISNASNIALIYNVTDQNNNLANATLILNGIRNTTNQSTLINNGFNNFTMVLPDGFYTWTVNITDTTNLIGTNTSIRNFTLDRNAPNITLLNPLAGATFAIADIFFNFTITDNLDQIAVCDLVVDSVVRRNDFNASNGSTINFTETMSTGLHYWNVSCIDDAQNFRISLTRNFTVTDTPPSVILVSPANANISGDGNVTLIYNTTDNNGFFISSLILNGIVNRTNQTSILNGMFNNFSLLNLVEGNYTWNVNVTDNTQNNATGTLRSFLVDLYPPSVVLNLPLNNSNSNTSNINFNFTATDRMDTVLNCSMYVGEYSNIGFVAPNGTVTNRLFSSLTDGLKLWNVSCFDDANHINISATRRINITERPTVYLNITNNTFYNVSAFNLNYTPIDNTNFSSCSLYLNGVLNLTNQSVINNRQINNFALSDMDDGVYNWYVSCNDTFNLQNQSEIRRFTVDNDGMSIELLYPENASDLFNPLVTFSYNVTDNLDTSLECNITVNSAIVNSSSAVSGNITNRTYNFPDGGLKFWNVTCRDDANNFVTSQTRNFTLAFAPIVSLSSPANNTITNISDIIFIYEVEDDNDNLANATLILNGIRNTTNQSELINGYINNFTITLPDGYYNWTVNVTDTTNLIGTNRSVRRLAIDTSSPNITLNAPANNSLFTWNNITFNFTVGDNLSPNSTCDLYLNAALEMSNILAVNNVSRLVYLAKPDGQYTWNLFCRDFANNSATSPTYNFSVLAPPNVTLVSPVNAVYINTSTVNFQYIPSDGIGLTNCSLIINDQINASIDEPDNGLTNQFTVNNFNEGNYNWTVQCIDASPDFNSYTAQMRNFTIDLTVPNITMNNPLNQTNNLRNVLFNFTVNDNLSSILNCNLYIDNILNESSLFLSSGFTYTTQKNRMTLGAHTWNVTCLDQANNLGRSHHFNFNVTLADMSVDTSDISINVSNPKENETILITAAIHNLVNVTTTQVQVRFYINNASASGNQIGVSQNITLSPYEVENVSVAWNSRIGSNVVFVLVDPPIASNGSIEEWNESNNQANRTITVDAWHYVYGDVNSETEFQLADRDRYNVIRWANTNFTSGNLYVADYESNIYWPTLTAIGKNSTGQNISNDFAEIDTRLNMTGFGDSVNVTYTNASLPRNVSSFKVFNRIITEVPVANSINNSNFVTGILWDLADSTNGQYDTTDVEDILFVTKINQNLVGTYGTYDYEIRIPANLRTYKTNQMSGVMFYTEIY